MEGRVILGVEFLVKGRLEDRIGGVHVLEDVIARGSEEHADRGYTARGRDLQEAFDETHLVWSAERGGEDLGGSNGKREGVKGQGCKVGASNAEKEKRQRKFPRHESFSVLSPVCNHLISTMHVDLKGICTNNISMFMCLM